MLKYQQHNGFQADPLDTISTGIGVKLLHILMAAMGSLFGQTNLPRVEPEILGDYQKLSQFVASFIRADGQARNLRSPANTAIFNEGIRPVIGVPNRPEAEFQKNKTLEEYFCRKLYLDLSTVKPVSEASLTRLADFIGAAGDKTLSGTGELVSKYEISLNNPFDYKREFAKVTDSQDRQLLKQFWLNDTILGAEFRMLSWMYQGLYGKPYVLPENRR